MVGLGTTRSAMEMVCNAERAGLTSEDERAREGEDGEEEDDGAGHHVCKALSRERFRRGMWR